ncbi:cell wall hydrolase [Aureimonas frigidaquae]|uniref:Cell wall hydrolase, SleB n=1 Tax=Aureimonas frigidaquae TaxID=424757 RepID=A0A0P0Z0Y6_9HYPH|nr:cell wall hydrolase, SleB [Aureimonas frigidaquae]
MNTSDIAGRKAIMALALLGLSALGACQSTDMAALTPEPKVDPKDRDCLARAMYFESNRSSDEGMLAVGTVVMNRVHSGTYPDTVCGVVAQKNQFAPGVMTRPMTAGKDRAERVAEAVLKGERHSLVGDAKFFHTAGMSFGYPNMNYVAVAGGNAFYQRLSRQLREGRRMTSQSEARTAQAAHIAAGKPLAMNVRAVEATQAQGAHSGILQALQRDAAR